MSLPARINSLLNLVPFGSQLPVRRELPQLLTGPETRMIGNEITIYPEDGGERYIDKGYKKNDGVYSIVSKNINECGQVRLYLLAIKRSEQKVANEYRELKKGPMNDQVLKELAKMKKTMTENYVVDTPLAKLLNRPNRRQTQSEFIQNLMLNRELQGEGNIWLNIPEGGKRPVELFVIPKPQLNIVGTGKDPWDIVRYEFVLSGNTYEWETDRVVMWNYPNPEDVDALTMAHLRGMAPLQAAFVQVQAANEADLRLATSNKNGGAMGLAFRSDVANLPTDPAQKAEFRSQFNNIVNSNEMANKVAMQAGQWGYLDFSTSVKDQQLLEQYGIGFKRLCRVFQTPAQIFDEGNGTWDNQKQAYRHWIYSKIGPMIHGMTEKLNESLLLRFDLVPERFMIDGDIMSLPAMATDLKEQLAAMEKADFLSDNEKRSATGYEPRPGKINDLTAREYESFGISGSLDDDINALDDL